MNNLFILPGHWGSGKIKYPKGVLDLSKFVREYLQANAVPSIPQCCGTVTAGNPVRYNTATSKLEYSADGVTWVVISSF